MAGYLPGREHATGRPPLPGAPVAKSTDQGSRTQRRRDEVISPDETADHALQRARRDTYDARDAVRRRPRQTRFETPGTQALHARPDNHTLPLQEGGASSPGHSLPEEEEVVVGTSVKRLRPVCLKALLSGLCGLHPTYRRCLVWCITASGGPSHQGRSPRLASSGFGSPGPCFWRPELREGVDDQPRTRGQVASWSDSQPNYPPRLKSRIKTRRVHFIFGCACLCVSLSCPSRIVKCFCLYI